MSKTYPCPAEVEDDCGYPTCAHAAQCERAAKERLARTACSRSLDVFESWEQFCRVKITGYTLRDGTDVCRFNFPTGKPNARTTDSMNLLIKNGWQITAIHYENAEIRHRAEGEGRNGKDQ